MQLHFLIAIIAVPYYCAMDNYTRVDDCLQNPDGIDIAALRNQTLKYERDGLIDPTEDMFSDRLFIYNGLNDTALVPGQQTS